MLPFGSLVFPGSGQAIYYAEGPVPELDTVNLDQSHGPVLLDAEAQLTKYRVLLDRLEAAALTPVGRRPDHRVVVSATPGAVPAGTRVADASPTAPAPTAGNLCLRRSAQHTATAAAANVAAERPAVKVTDGKTSPAAAAR